MRKHALTAGWLCTAILLAACSGGQNSTPPVSTPLSSDRATQSSAPDTTPIQYDVSPSYRLAAASTGPAALPPPSQCAKLLGFACYTPSLIRSAYDVPSSADGAAQTIVIVDAYGSPTIRTDLRVFDQAFGLPDPALNIIYPGGKPTYNPLQNHHELNWAAETTLDVEWSHAIAPRATIDLVIAANNGGNVLNLAESYAVKHHLGNVMSLSFGTPEADIHGLGNNLQLQQAHAVYVAAQSGGMSVFVSAGDSGASNGLGTANAAFPASDPLVTSVGGTDLFMSDAGAYQSETAWNDSNPSLCPFGCGVGAVGATGGAPSRVFAAPTYQAGVTGFATRTTADVGYNASLYTGILTFMSFRGLTPGFYFSGGTSEGAPQWAAIAALADESAGHALGLLNPKLYAIRGSARGATDFHDVTVGDNGFFGPGFPAVPGYDPPTGIGTPDVANLIADLSK